MIASMSQWLDQVHFVRPLWLLALVPMVLLIAALWRRPTQAEEWRNVVAPHLLGYLLDNKEHSRRRTPSLALAALWALAIIALAGPAWQKMPQPVQKSGAALVVLWDMSPSMMAQDITPSRLTRSRLKLTDLLRQRREGVTGLIAYAGESHVVTPLTDDTRTIMSLLPALSPANMPVAGSNPEMALREAFRLLEDAGAARGNVLMITDGIAPQAFGTLDRIARGAKHQLTIWGVGTTEGAPIPLPRGGFARDASGSIVVAKLNEDEIQNLAADINAYYVPMHGGTSGQSGNSDLATLMTLFKAPGENLREANRLFDQWYEHGPWLLLVALPFVALLFRRGWLMCLPMFLVPMGLPQTAEASAWENLWRTKNQQAERALAQEQPEKAAQLFEDPSWRGTALYRAGDYEAAVKAFQTAENTSDNLYNQGNALMQLGEYEKAIEAYKKALEVNPDNADASANKALAEKLLKQQQDQQQQEQNQNGEGDSQGNQQQSQQGDQQDQANPQNQQGQNPSDENQEQSGGGQQQDQPYDNPNNNRPGERQQEEDNAQDQQQEQDSQKAQADQRKAEPEQAGQERPTAQPSDQDSQERPQGQAATTQMTEQEREQQQALEQWLRKVPDDPSGLLRNKFQHEYRERRRTNNWQPPDNDARQRW